MIESLGFPSHLGQGRRNRGVRGVMVFHFLDLPTPLMLDALLASDVASCLSLPFSGSQPHLQV